MKNLVHIDSWDGLVLHLVNFSTLARMVVVVIVQRHQEWIALWRGATNTATNNLFKLHMVCEYCIQTYSENQSPSFLRDSCNKVLVLKCLSAYKAAHIFTPMIHKPYIEKLYGGQQFRLCSPPLQIRCPVLQL